MHCGLRLADGGMTRRLASVRVFLTNPVTKRCQRCRAMNFPFGRNQTKQQQQQQQQQQQNLQGKGGRKVNNSSNQ